MTADVSSAAASAPAQVQQQAGFTLLELLVVLLILGILTTLATLSLGGDAKSHIKDEARRFAALAELATEESILQGRVLGLDFHAGGYRFLFMSMDDKGQMLWLPLDEDRILRPRDMHPEIRPQLLLDGLPYTLPERANEEPTPHIFFLSSGERTPFELRLGRREGDTVYRIKADAVGAIELHKEPS